MMHWKVIENILKFVTTQKIIKLISNLFPILSKISQHLKILAQSTIYLSRKRGLFNESCKDSFCSSALCTIVL